LRYLSCEPAVNRMGRTTAAEGILDSVVHSVSPSSAAQGAH